MKKLLLALFLSIAAAAPAFAACTPGFIITPGSGANQTFSTKAAGDTNCESMVDEDTSSQFHTDFNTLHTDLGTLNTTAGSSIAAGSNIIGKVGIDQTTPGTTNAVSATNFPATVDTNSGNKSASTIRTVAATDQPAIPAAGQGATGAAAPAGATQAGCVGSNVEQTAVTNGQMTAVTCGLGGKTIVLPFSVKELAVRGSASSTDALAHTIIAAATGSNKNYITDWECYNTSAATVTVAFNDSASTTIIVPAGSGNNKHLGIPLVTAAATAFQFTSSSGQTTVGCSAQGYTGL